MALLHKILFIILFINIAKSLFSSSLKLFENLNNYFTLTVGYQVHIQYYTLVHPNQLSYHEK